MGTIIVNEETGERFEVLECVNLASSNPKKATHFIAQGLIKKAISIPRTYSIPLRRIPVQYTFGVLTLEETGEERTYFERGDFFLTFDNIVWPERASTFTYANKKKVLRVVSVETT